MTLVCLVEEYRRVKGTCWLHSQDRYINNAWKKHCVYKDLVGPQQGSGCVSGRWDRNKESNNGPNLGRLLGVGRRAKRKTVRETEGNNATELIIK
jgi:hypothetical protein